MWSKFFSSLVELSQDYDLAYVYRICMKYIKSATNKMKNNKDLALRGEPSLIERVIELEKSEKLATIMALDMILVGIDTVSVIKYFKK